MKRNVALVAMVLACLFMGTSAFAVVIGNVRPVAIGSSGEPPLFNGSTGLLDGVANPAQLSADYFVPSNLSGNQGLSEFKLEFRYAANSNAISLYSIGNILNTITVFPGSLGPVSDTVVSFKENGSGTWDLKSYDGFNPSTVYGSATFSSPTFGFLLNSNGQLWYGDDSLNTYAGHTSSPQMLVFNANGGGYYFGFEDLPYYTGDHDFNDVVFYAQSITPVPEPGTMMLLGSGLVGLAGWGRKKFRK